MYYTLFYQMIFVDVNPPPVLLYMCTYFLIHYLYVHIYWYYTLVNKVAGIKLPHPGIDIAVK